MTQRDSSGSRLARCAAWAACGLATPAAAQPLQLVDNPALGSFHDIAGIGEQVFVGDDGEAEIIEFFEGSFVFLPGPVAAGANGGLGFAQRTITELEALNEPIPSLAAFLGGQAALAAWDDIDDKDGDVQFAQFSGDPVLGDRFIVQWDQPDFDGLGSTLRVQAHVLDNPEPTGIYAQYMYEIDGPAAGAGGSATIGYQDGDGGFGDLQFSFNEPGAVVDGTVLTLLIAGPGDVDADGMVGVEDLLLLLAGWGPCADCGACAADLDGDCRVGSTDLLMLLANWG